MDILCDYCKPEMPPGRGYAFAVSGGTYHHPGQCREVETPWRIYWHDRVSPHYDFLGNFDPHQHTGVAIREDVYEPDGHPYPQDAPGYKRLSDNWVEAIVVLIRGETPKDVTGGHEEHDAEHDQDPYYSYGDDEWEIPYRVRPATPEEAAGVLLDEAHGAYDGPVD